MLFRIPQLREVSVFGLPDLKWGETVNAAVVLKEGATIEAHEVIALCREHIAHYKSPKRVFFLDELPRNALGKVTKFVLQQLHSKEGQPS